MLKWYDNIIWFFFDWAYQRRIGEEEINNYSEKFINTWFKIILFNANQEWIDELQNWSYEIQKISLPKNKKFKKEVYYQELYACYMDDFQDKPSYRSLKNFSNEVIEEYPNRQSKYNIYNENDLYKIYSLSKFFFRELSILFQNDEYVNIKNIIKKYQEINLNAN